MTAIDELRAMLDERGVKWTKPKRIWWELIDCEPDDSVTIVEGVTIEAATDGTLVVYPLTPEQAIAATLGASGTCIADETETISVRGDMLGNYYFDKHFTIHVMECSECGRTYEHVNGGYEFCPMCGRKVVDE